MPARKNKPKAFRRPKPPAKVLRSFRVAFNITEDWVGSVLADLAGYPVSNLDCGLVENLPPGKNRPSNGMPMHAVMLQAIKDSTPPGLKTLDLRKLATDLGRPGNGVDNALSTLRKGKRIKKVRDYWVYVK